MQATFNATSNKLASVELLFDTGAMEVQSRALAASSSAATTSLPLVAA